MPAAKYNITIDQGSDFELSIQVYEDDDIKNLDGYDARAQLRSKADSPHKVDFDTTGSSFDATGTVKITLANSVTKGIDAGDYVYDIEIFESGDSSVTRILQGKATVTGEVTR